MHYFSGFSLQKEKELFHDYLIESETCVSGFSYGAQQAFEYVYHSSVRIDRLILLSPAFFQTQKKSFIRTQLRYFDTNKSTYIKTFLNNVTYPSSFDLDAYVDIGTVDELEKLLTYIWDIEKIQEVLNRGTTIEVFLGEEDKIVHTKDTLSFFKPLVPTYCIKNAGHLLKGHR